MSGSGQEQDTAHPCDDAAVPIGAPVLSLPPRFDLAAATAMLPVLDAAIVTGGAAIDGLGVKRIGLAGLQLLASARLTAVARGVPLAIIGSAALREAAEIAGLERVLFGQAG
jgi:anti-anti-sigma regulatory factor